MSSPEASTSRVVPSLVPVAAVQLRSRWVPKAYLDPPQPYPPDVERMNEPDMIPNPSAPPGTNETMRNPKKVRPRRTVDYNGTLARWRLLKRMRPSPDYIPNLRPAATFIIDLLPPKAYLNNSSTSIATKFVHTSMNKMKFPVNVVAWTPEGRRVLTGSTSGEFTLWNGLTFNFETILQAHDTAIRAFQFSHNGAYLVSADQSGILKYFQPNMNNLVMWNGHKEAIRGVSFSPDDTRFATGSDDQTIKLWDFQTRSEERTFTGHGWDVKCVEWHPTMGLLASGSKDNLVKFWDPRTGQSLSTLHFHKGTIQAIQWSPNGNCLATASRDQTVRVFDIRAMKELQLFKGHTKDVCSVTWHPVHHDLLTSGDAEGTMMYWSLGHPTPRATLAQAHDSNIWALAWHPLGHILASGSNDYTLRFWSRSRPGEGSGRPRIGGGEHDQDDPDQDEQDDDGYVPGLGAGPSAEQAGNNQPNGDVPMWGVDSQGAQSGAGGSNGNEGFIPGLGGPSRSAAPVEEQSFQSGQGSQSQQFGRGGGSGYGRGGRDFRDRNSGRDDFDGRGRDQGYGGRGRGGRRGGDGGGGRGYSRY